MILHIILCLTSTYIWTNSIPEKMSLETRPLTVETLKVRIKTLKLKTFVRSTEMALLF